MKKLIAFACLMALTSCAGMPNGKKSPCPKKATTDYLPTASAYADPEQSGDKGCTFQSFDLSKSVLGESIE